MDGNVNEIASRTSNCTVDANDWVLVPSEHEVGYVTEPVIRKKPLFELHVSLKLGDADDTCMPRHHPRSFSDRPRSLKKRSTSVMEQEQSHLFMLPSEIRLRIYHLLLRPAWTNEHGVRMTRSPKHPKVPTVLSILRTCRRALCEAEQIFFASNRLWIDDVDFLRNLRPNRRQALSALVVPAQSASMIREVLVNLHGFSNLKSLHFVRQVSIKYLSISSWRLLVPQMLAEADKLAPIPDFEIFTPEASELTAFDAERKERLDSIDKRLQQAIRKTVQ